MAFTVTYENGGFSTWHVNNKKPPVIYWNPDDNSAFQREIKVTRFYADGDELEFIRQVLKVPITNRIFSSCTWRNEMARFIYDNL